MYIHHEGAHSSIRSQWPPVGSESLLRMKHSQFLQLAPITGNINTLSFWSLPLDLPTLSLDCEFVEGKKSFWQVLDSYILQHIRTHIVLERKFKAHGSPDLSASVSTEVNSLSLTHTFCNWTQWSFLHPSSLWRSRRCASPNVSWPA